jgi:hypothetical protein
MLSAYHSPWRRAQEAPGLKIGIAGERFIPGYGGFVPFLIVGVRFGARMKP